MKKKGYSLTLTVVIQSFFLSILFGTSGAEGRIEAQPSDDPRYGAHLLADGWVHFGVFAPQATAVNLLIFKEADAVTPQHVIPMRQANSDWRIRAKGEQIGHGTLYMYQAKGPHEVSPNDQYGLMFNEQFFLSDPYAYLTQNVSFSRLFSEVPHTTITGPVYAGGGKSVVYDHQNDASPGHLSLSPEDLIVYELHVQDYTSRIQSLDPSKRGTYVGLATGGLTTPGGLAAGIDHLVELGVTAVELMPVMEYDEETGNAVNRLNHWGYMTSNFFAPEARYAANPGNHVIELKHLIKAFHDRGIAVFLDVVYNHTAEQSPWLDPQSNRLAAKYYNFRGLSNTQMYRSTGDGLFYFNNTGTGNDVTFQGPLRTYPKHMVRDSLAFWHNIYGIDGFRFDLARILADGSDNAADWVDNDMRFTEAHLHAEPWDLGGQWYDFMDNFGWSHANNRWAKWLGKYRDHIRRFSASNLQNRRAFKKLIEGYGLVSEDGGSTASTKPWRSINFLAIHDGYTLRDCVFFNDIDGSHNCWDSGQDENLRREREKLLLGILFTSQGVPLLLQGDEFGRTKSSARSQAEAHNTYNYESSQGDQTINHVNWIDWRLKDGDTSESPHGPGYGKELFHWTKDLISLRKQWTHFKRREFPEYVQEAWNDGANAGNANNGKFSYMWQGPEKNAPTQLGVIWWGTGNEPDLMVIYNEHFEELTVNNLREWSQGDWKILARSWFGDDADVCELSQWESNCEAAGSEITLKGRSMAILLSDND